MKPPVGWTDQEWLVLKVGVLYALGAAAFLLAWWKGWLNNLPPGG